MGKVMEDLMTADVEVAAKRLAELNNKINDALRNTFRQVPEPASMGVITFNPLSITAMGLSSVCSWPTCWNVLPIAVSTGGYSCRYGILRLTVTIPSMEHVRCAA